MLYGVSRRRVRRSRDQFTWQKQGQNNAGTTDTIVTESVCVRVCVCVVFTKGVKSSKRHKGKGDCVCVGVCVYKYIYIYIYIQGYE